jgi:hypothetical protein
MKAYFDNVVWDAQDYVEEVTGDRPCWASLPEMEAYFERNEINLWNYPLDEVEHIMENGLRVCLVRFADNYGGFEYRWCELPEE